MKPFTNLNASQSSTTKSKIWFFAAEISLTEVLLIFRFWKYDIEIESFKTVKLWNQMNVLEQHSSFYAWLTALRLTSKKNWVCSTYQGDNYNAMPNLQTVQFENRTWNFQYCVFETFEKKSYLCVWDVKSGAVSWNIVVSWNNVVSWINETFATFRS